MNVFSALTSLGGTLSISDNIDLRSLDGLENLNTIPGALQISGNTRLNSVLGLENLTSLGGDLSIQNNPLLSTCAANDLLTQLSPPPANVIVTGNQPSASCASNPGGL